MNTRYRMMIIAILAAACVGPVSGDQGTVDLESFDEEVAVFRRVVREYCAVVQSMMRENDLDSDQQKRGLALLAQARPLWRSIQDTYAANPPAEYAGDRSFRARLSDISNASDDMERALANGDARRSMLACGFACGLFVRMHEENGLNYAIDKLFHLRAEIRVSAAAVNVQGLAAVRDRIAGLLQKRDAVLLAPPPFKTDDARSSAYTEAVEELSRAMDQLALAVATEDQKQIRDILANGVSLVNKPYGIAL